MKTKNLFLSLSLGAVAALGVSSCSDYTEWSESEIRLDAAMNEFTKNFEARYGTIDPEQTWGFGPVVSPTTRGEVINKNEWIDVYHMQVPGWPDLYYCKNDETIHNGGYHTLDDEYTAILNASIEPGGDVTDEEIKYVSWWFRTHRYPTSLPVHWSDFYIQEVSSDNDRDAQGYVDNSFVLFQYREADQSWEKSFQHYPMTMDYLGVKTQDDPDNFVHLEKFNGTRQNKLHTVDKLPMDTDEQFKANNNNVFNDNVTVDGVAKKLSDITNTRLIDYYTCMSTEDFMCHNSVDNTDRSNYKFENNEEATPIWVMVHLHFIGPSGRIYDGYYLGFDFASFKNNGTSYEMREPDGYYSNWIVKISPGVPIVNSQYTRRIMCEDLGNTLDFDYDDIVFDATINQDNTIVPVSGEVDVTINLMAAGGTMPVYVGNYSSAFEAHHLFNHAVTTPVNVGGVNAPVANYHTTISGLTPGSYFDFDAIPIYVVNTRNGGAVEKLPQDIKYLNCKNEYEKVVDTETNNHIYVKSKNSDDAPQKFAVPSSVLWLRETHQIEKGYPKFGDWAQNHKNYPIFTTKEKDGSQVWSYEDNTTSAWYVTNVDKSHLCGQAGMNPYNNDPTPGSLNNTGYPGTTSTFMKNKTWDVVPYVNNKSWGKIEFTDGAEVSGTGHMYYPDNNSKKTATLTATAFDNCTFLGWCDGNQPHGSYLTTDPTRGITINGNEITIEVSKREDIVAMFSGPKSSVKYKVTYSGTGVSGVHISGRNYDDGSCAYDEAKDEYNRARLRFAYTSVESGKTFIGWYVNGNLETENSEVECFIEGPTVIEARAGKNYNIPVTMTFLDEEGNKMSDEDAHNSGIKLVFNNSNTLPYITPIWDDQSQQLVSQYVFNQEFPTVVGKDVWYRIEGDNLSQYDIKWGDSLSHDNEGSFTIFDEMFLTVTFQKKATSPEAKKRISRK